MKLWDHWLRLKRAEEKLERLEQVYWVAYDRMSDQHEELGRMIERYNLRRSKRRRCLAKRKCFLLLSLSSLCGCASFWSIFNEGEIPKPQNKPVVLPPPKGSESPLIGPSGKVIESSRCAVCHSKDPITGERFAGHDFWKR